MISNDIFNYYEFLENEDENYKGNYEIVDDGSEALYSILFKLMGDTRTFDSLCSDVLDWPAASELKYSAQDGEYSSVVDMMREKDCGMPEKYRKVVQCLSCKIWYHPECESIPDTVATKIRCGFARNVGLVSESVIQNR